MGSGASSTIQSTLKEASDADINKAFSELPEADRNKLLSALNSPSGGDGGEAAADTNAAFVFIKPHANTEKVRELAKKGLEEKKIKIIKEGSLDGPTIDSKKLIDNHYYAIAVKGTIKKPSELNVPPEPFEKAFGKSWEDVLKDGNVYNALDGCEQFGCDAAGMSKMWDQAKTDGKLVKLGGGFYCGLLKGEEKELYIFNGFFMSMRSKFTDKDASIQYFQVEWNPTDLSWSDFRNKVLGPTDPATAPEDSLRGIIYKQWEDLGLKAQPNTGDNGMHASASPFEGLAERANWLETPIADDIFGAKLLKDGMSAEMIKDWSVDPQVTIDKEASKKGSIFDALEDMDCADCARKLVELSKIQ